MRKYEKARQEYLEFGIDTDAAIKALRAVTISVQCWQGDDVLGFDAGGALSGGIQTTGNYPGKARTPKELMADMDLALSLIGGKKKINLHASYAIWGKDETPDRSKLEPRHFEPWVDFAKERKLGIDFNPTFFSHPMVKDNLTLSSPDDAVRSYWIEHGKCCVQISQYFAKQTGMPCLMNIWIPDGYKDYPADRLHPRARFRDSLDQILSVPYDKNKVYVTLESKVFGIGLEANTVGNAEFCLSYSDYAGITPLLDNGHYHPTESVADKISSLLLFHDKIALHVTRPMRWDSDHVVLFDDTTREIAQEIVRAHALDRVLLATDYFDASINRISAWVTGVRSLQKALLYALLEPHDRMRTMQDYGNFTDLMVLNENLKTAPFGAVWEEFLRREKVEADYLTPIKEYERKVMVNRK